MRSTILIIFLSIMLISCGISYSVPRATLHIDVLDKYEFNTTQDSISAFLITNGFTDLGKDEVLLALLERIDKERQSDGIAKTNDDEISRVNRTRRYKNEDLKVEVEIVDYSDITIKKRFASYPTSEMKITDFPSLELNVYNYRPGGFSVEAAEFYKELYSFIVSNNDGSILTIFSPPETNQSEFYKVTIINLLIGTLVWFFVYLVSIGIFGFILIKVLDRTRLTVAPKRIVFTLFGIVLATPLPFPAATLFVIALPSVFAIPAGSDYFIRIQEDAIPSFIVSAFLCALISIYFIKDKQS